MRARQALLGGVLVLGLHAAHADIRFRPFADDPDEPKWQESAFVLPDAPRDEDLLEFYVSAVTANRFFVDGKSLGVGADDVVRYTLVIRTAGGATNVSFEGMRCEAMEYRIYATGRPEGAWAPVRAGAWRPIENKTVNGYHAALSRNYFCPNRSPIRDADEGRNALRLGKHPRAE